MTEWIARGVHGLIAWWRGDTLSHRWLKAQERLEERVEFHGVTWRWPGSRV